MNTIMTTMNQKKTETPKTAAETKPKTVAKKPAAKKPAATTAKKATTSAPKKTASTKSAPKPKEETFKPRELPSNPFIFEILDAVSEEKTEEGKIEILKKYEHDALKAIFIWNYDTSIVSALPDGPVPYASTGEQNNNRGNLSEEIKDSVAKMKELQSNSLGFYDQGKTSIRKEYGIFYNFVKGGNPELSSIRRETMFINLLQGLHPIEAHILCLVKDKKLAEIYSIKRETISKAYPDIQWGNRS